MPSTHWPRGLHGFPWASYVPRSAHAGQGYMSPRYADTGHIFYVGEAHQRGVRARLDEYRLGNDLNGLGAVLADLALADAEFVRERLADIESGSPRTAVQWMKLAMERRNIQFSVSETEDGPSAQLLESRVLDAIPNERLLNKAAVRARRSLAVI